MLFFCYKTNKKYITFFCKKGFVYTIKISLNISKIFKWIVTKAKGGVCFKMCLKIYNQTLLFGVKNFNLKRVFLFDKIANNTHNFI